jgi:hypothetical protein
MALAERHRKAPAVHSTNDSYGEPLVITKILFGAMIAFAVSAGMATTANADPSSFGTLGCSCTSPVAASDGKAPIGDQLNQGIKNGLGYLQAPTPPANNS